MENYDYDQTSVLTICANCKKVKMNDLSWIDISSPFFNLVGEEVSHGICPSCISILYPDIADEIIDMLD